MPGLFDNRRPNIVKPYFGIQTDSKNPELQSFLLPVSRSMVASNPSFFQPIIFQFIPEIKDDGDSADFESLGDGLGRAEQYKIYKNGKSRSYSLTTTFAALDDSTNTAWVQQQVMRLRALTKPIYDRESLFNGTSTNYYAPPLVIFTYGKLWINIPVVVSSVSASTPDEAQIDANGLPTVVTVDIKMETNYPYGYVPGYMNYWRIWNEPDKQANYHQPKQLSFGGNITTTSETATFVTDQASTSGTIIEL